MTSKVCAYNSMSTSNSFTPRSDRRVIFPSLHRTSLPCSPAHLPSHSKPCSSILRNNMTQHNSSNRCHDGTLIPLSSCSLSERDSLLSSAAPTQAFPSGECDKRISFHARVTVYEFTTANYEKNGGDKWYSRHQLKQFRQEATRCRIRTRNVIHKGMGWAVTA